MLELAVSASITASSMFLFAFWCRQAQLLLMESKSAREETKESSRDLTTVE